jgi:hypothetical protein
MSAYKYRWPVDSVRFCQAFVIKSSFPNLKNAAKVDLGEGNSTGLKPNREIASSPAQNEAFTARTVDAAEALFLGRDSNSQEAPGV